MMTTTFGCGQWGWLATSSLSNIHEGLLGGFWGKLWSLIASHGFLVWS
jgi:hypothetical protein